MRLNLSDIVGRKPKPSGAATYSRNEIVWERGNLVKWIKACRADMGSPRFVRFGQELESAHKITGICWGGYNRAPGARTVTFRDIGDDDIRLLSDPNKKDWVQLINKYGSQNTKVELLQNTKGFMELRLKCEDCYPPCIGVDCNVN